MAKTLQRVLCNVAESLQIERVGRQHQAGSDSLLTGAVFFWIGPLNLVWRINLRTAMSDFRPAVGVTDLPIPSELLWVMQTECGISAPLCCYLFIGESEDTCLKTVAIVFTVAFLRAINKVFAAVAFFTPYSLFQDTDFRWRCWYIWPTQ